MITGSAMKGKKALGYSILALAIITGAYLLAGRIVPNSPNETIKLDTIVYHVCENEKIGNARVVYGISWNSRAIGVLLIEQRENVYS